MGWQRGSNFDNLSDARIYVGGEECLLHMADVQVRKSSMARILCDNSGVSQMQPLAFQTPSGVNQVTVATMANFFFCENKKKHVLSTRWLAATGWDRSQGQALNAGLPAADKPTINDPSFYSSYSFSNSAYLQIYNIYLMHFMRVKILPIDPSTLSRPVKTVTVNFSKSQQSLSTFLMRQSPQCQHVQCTILR